MAIRITSAASNTLRSGVSVQGGANLWSMMVWVKTPVPTSGQQTIYSFESTTVGTPIVKVRFLSTGNINAQIFNGNNAAVTLGASGAIPNQWYCVALTSTVAASITLYVWDHTGLLVGSTTVAGTATGTPASMQWGCYSTTHDLLDGTLAYGMIIGSVLTRSQLEGQLRLPRPVYSTINQPEWWNPFDVAAASGYAYVLNPYNPPQANSFSYGSTPPYDAGATNIPLVRQTRRRLRIRRRAFYARGAFGSIGVVFRRTRSGEGTRVGDRQQALN